jgi:hypothetical protein
VKKTAASKGSARWGSAGIATRRAIWFEIGAVLFLICAPQLGDLGCRLIWGEEYRQLVNKGLVPSSQTPTTYDTHLFESTFHILRYIPIVLFVIWRSGCDWSKFGLVRPRWGKDILIGVSLSLIIASVECFVHVVTNGQYPLPDFFPVVIPWHRVVLLLGQCCAIACSEELWGRAYLILYNRGFLGNVESEASSG